jgi:hypothetical protein
MTDHAHVLAEYKRIRDVRFRLNNLLVGKIPKQNLQDCARELGLFHQGTLVFDSEQEMHVLMDYCLYRPDRDGRNMVARYLETLQPPAGSDEMVALKAMTAAYYSIFQITEVERGVGVVVEDLLRDETGFIVDVGFGNTAKLQLGVATRIVPFDGYLTTGGAALPLDRSAIERILTEMVKKRTAPANLDFTRISPEQEAELAAIIIRASLSAGMSSHVAYGEPGSRPRATTTPSRRRKIGRNEPCPCGSGRKYKMCCALRTTG